MQFLERNHIVPGFCPIDINGGKDSDVISMKNYNHVAILLELGVIHGSADADITIYGCDDVAHTNAVALATIKFRKMSATDTWAAAVSVTDSKLDLVTAGDIDPATNNQLVVIDLDAVEVKKISADYEIDCLYVSISDPGQSVIASCMFVLSEPRYGSDSMPSAIVD